MKRLMYLTVMLVVVFVPTTTVFAHQTANGVVVNGKDLSLDVKPIINKRGVTLVPARAIIESLGFEVVWDKSSGKVTATNGNDKLVLTVGKEDENYYNGVRIYTSTPAQIIDGRTLVPVRLSAELFDFDVDWNNSTRKVIINSSSGKSKISLKQAHDLLANEIIDSSEEVLVYMPLDSGASNDEDIKKNNYIFNVMSDYGYGLEFTGGASFLVDRNTGKLYTYDDMSS